MNTDEFNKLLEQVSELGAYMAIDGSGKRGTEFGELMKAVDVELAKPQLKNGRYRPSPSGRGYRVTLEYHVPTMEQVIEMLQTGHGFTEGGK